MGNSDTTHDWGRETSKSPHGLSSPVVSCVRVPHGAPKYFHNPTATIKSSSSGPPSVSLSSSTISPSLSKNQVRSEGGNNWAAETYSNSPNPEAYSLILHPSEEDMQIVSILDNNNRINLGTKSKKRDCSSLGFSETPSTSEAPRTNFASTNRNTTNLSASSKPSAKPTFGSSDVREKENHKNAPVKTREKLDIQPHGGHVAPDLSFLGPKYLSLNSKIDSFEISIPRRLISSGMYYFLVDNQSDGGKFQLTKSEQHPVEGG